MDAFNVSNEIADLVTTVFLLGYVFGVNLSQPCHDCLSNYSFQPLLWGPGSELLGRRPIFFVLMIVYNLLYLGQALAHNIQTLLVTRFLCGFCVVAPLTIGSGKQFCPLYDFTGKLSVFNTGIIADIWSAVGRGPALNLFVGSVFLGTASGPLVAGLYVSISSPLCKADITSVVSLIAQSLGDGYFG